MTHENTDDLQPLIKQQMGRDAAVDAARHGKHHT